MSTCSDLRRSKNEPRSAPVLADNRIPFTDGIVEPDQLYRRLLDGILKEQIPPSGAGVWTRAVKKTLRIIAHEADPLIVVYPNDSGGEFLLDLIWLKPARDDADANGKILLAVECEWAAQMLFGMTSRSCSTFERPENC